VGEAQSARAASPFAADGCFQDELSLSPMQGRRETPMHISLV
jgi:hypothetical protein